ncbi:MAG: nuclear transport factor 2 family protein, partial [Anaerolineales bacterium]
MIQADSCQEIYEEQIAAWDSRDLDRIRDVYTEDIVHFDGEPAYVGIEDVIFMARTVLMMLSDWSMDAGSTYISRSDCLGTWINWGFRGATEENPMTEFDLIEIHEGKISFWRLFYDEEFDFSPIDRELLTRFAEVWSARNNHGLEEIYAEDAVLEDSLFGVEAVGLEEIEAYAKALKKGYSLGSWELEIPFSEDGNPDPDLEPANGGVYQIASGGMSRNSCQVNAVVILSTNKDGKIAHQLTLYQA